MLLLDINKFINRNDVKQITTANIMRADRYDDNGLFSQLIFGLPNSSKWRTNFAYIALNTQILHPLLYEIAERRCSILLKLFKGEVSYDEKTKSIIKGGAGGWGIPYFIDKTQLVIEALFASGSLTEAGEKLCRYILKYKDYAFIDNYIVIPPQYRPIEVTNGKVETSAINNYYQAMLNDSNVARFSEGETMRAVSYKLQTSVYMAFKELEKLIKGKQGLQRKSLLGKTLDFSARAVITGDTHIKPNHFGVPKRIALSLFKYHLIHELTTTGASQLQSFGYRPTQLVVGRLIDDTKEGSNEIPQHVKDYIIEVLTDVIKDKVIIVKRDPCLHRHSIRAHYIDLVDDDSFHISPLVCEPYNAD